MQSHTIFSAVTKAALARVTSAYPTSVAAKTVSPGCLSTDQFTQGVIKWLTIANTPYESRTSWSGDGKLRGLYYPQDFQKFIPDIGSSVSLVGLCHAEYWDVAQSKQRLLFKASSDHQPSEALAAFFEGPTFTDCGTVLQACIYKSIEEMLGTNVFNQVFSATETSFIITPKLFSAIPTAEEAPALSVEQRLAQGNPLLFLFDELPWDETTVAAAGDIIYMSGVDKYAAKHYTGAAKGWNLICLDNIVPKHVFLGFGPSEFREPLTITEIKSLFIRAYNQDQSSDTLAAYTEAMTERPRESMWSTFARSLPFMNTEKLAHDKVSDDYDYVCHTGAIRRFNVNKLKEFVAAKLASDPIDELTSKYKR